MLLEEISILKYQQNVEASLQNSCALPVYNMFILQYNLLICNKMIAMYMHVRILSRPAGFLSLRCLNLSGYIRAGVYRLGSFLQKCAFSSFVQ